MSKHTKSWMGKERKLFRNEDEDEGEDEGEDEERGCISLIIYVN